MAIALTPEDNTLFDVYPWNKEYSKSVIDRVITKVINRLDRDENGCWNYTGALSKGYGRITVKVKTGRSPGRAVSYSVHKFMYRFFVGPVNQYELIRHLCNNKACCNPKHLATGSYMDNTNDYIESQRSEEEWQLQMQI